MAQVVGAALEHRHSKPEETENAIADRREPGVKASKKNEFEAELVISCVKYFIQQGYETENIEARTGNDSARCQELGVQPGNGRVFIPFCRSGKNATPGMISEALSVEAYASIVFWGATLFALSLRQPSRGLG
jgi:hypothetical protein